MHACPFVDPGPKPHVGGPVLPPGEPTVWIGGQPAARVTDKCTCVGPPDIIAKGSFTVQIGKRFAARVGDLTVHGGSIVVGCPTVMIGEVGMGGVAPGAPGGPGVNGPFNSVDEAANAALQAANPQSIHENLEFSGLIYQGADGKYYYTGPARGTLDGADPLSQAPAPPGTTVVGDYHTHANYSTKDSSGNIVPTEDPSKDIYDSDNFSPQDKSDSNTQGYPGYLGTPSGTFRKYDPATGADTVL
jgi:uncharacterized Zn-binding protein involved in type VI secretion